MKILFFIEPNYEFNNVSFRIPTIKCIIANVCKYINPENQIAILSETEVLKEASLYIPNNVTKISIKKEIYTPLFSNWEEYGINAFKRTINKNELSLLVEKIQKEINGFSPDIVINYESASSQLLEQCFPNAKIVNMMFGPFSRVPFPSTTFLDLQGLYYNSEIAKLKTRKLTTNEENCLRALRRRTNLCLSELVPCKALLDQIQRKFRKIILVCCQLNGYFAFKGCSECKNQIELVEKTLRQTSSDYAVIVTGHNEFQEQYEKAEVEKLEAKYPNCIFIKEKIPYISQWLVPYVDAVVTVSSSVGYQTVFWNKILIVDGESQLSPLSQAKLSENKINDLVAGKIQYQNKDSVLYDILSRYTFFDKEDIFSPSINNILEKINKGVEYHNKLDPNELKRKFLSMFRGIMLKELFKKNNIQTTIDYFRQALSKHTFCSFDVFDTLIERPFIEPWHLFVLMQDKVQNMLHDCNFQFTYFRRQAEAECRRNAGPSVEVTIEDIYEEFKNKTGIEPNLCKKILQIEIEMELDVCKASRWGESEYKIARLLSSKLFIISDTYLHKKTIETILLNSGYSNWDELYASADTILRKHDGKLFKLVLKNNNIVPNLLIHFGDNGIADLQRPREYGIGAYQIPSKQSNYQRSFINRYLDCNYNITGLGGSILSGMILNKLFSSNHNLIDKDSAFNGDPYLLGYCAVGPMIFGFINWIHRKSIRNKDRHIYFLARDGWLPYQAYNLIYGKNAIENSYIKLSRRCVSVPAINSIEDIYEITFQSFEARTLGDLLQTRFGIQSKEINEQTYSKHGLTSNTIITPIRCMNKLRKFMSDISPVIFKHAQEEKKNLLKYLQKNNLTLELSDNVAFVDIGYSGSMQRYISKILNTDKINGMYYLTHFFSRNRFEFKKEQIDGYFTSEDDHRSCLHHSLNDYVFLFESILSSSSGSIVKFNDDLTPEYIYAENEKERVSLLNKIHAGAINFISEIRERINQNNNDVLLYEFSSRISSEIIINFFKHPSKKDAKIFLDIGVENQFGGGSTCLIERTENAVISDEEKKGIVLRSKWKEGAISYYENNTCKNITNTSIKSSNQIDDLSNKTVIKQSITNKISEMEIQNIKRIKLKQKLENNPALFFSDSKYTTVRICGKIAFSKITPKCIKNIILNITNKNL